MTKDAGGRQPEGTGGCTERRPAATPPSVAARLRRGWLLLGRASAVLALLGGVMLPAFYGCGSSAVLNGDGGGGSGGEPSPASTSSSSSQGAGGDLAVASVGTGFGGRCADVVTDAVHVRAPADLIWVIDNSASMAEEIAAIEQTVNPHLAQPLDVAGVDHQSILLTSYGAGPFDVCIPPPLGASGDCSGQPTNVASKLYQYSASVGTHDSLCMIMETLNGLQPDDFNLAPGGWSDWLRPEALKVFVEASDDGVQCILNSQNLNDNDNSMDGLTVAAAFEQLLLGAAPQHFGTAADKNYVWYSLVGMIEKSISPPVEPWLPSDPINLAQCAGAGGPGTAYQSLSIGTEGLRFPSCPTIGYDSIFQAIAADIAEQTVQSCRIEIPDPPQGQALDLNTLAVRYTPGGNGEPQELPLVFESDYCASVAGFFIDGNVLQLCPQICATIEADPNPDLKTVIPCIGYL